MQVFFYPYIHMYGKILETVFIQEYTGQRKLVFWHILPSEKQSMLYFLPQN